MDELCIVGGLVPSLIIDRALGGEPETGEQHSGTNDLDVGLAVALLDDAQYAEISRRLRQEGFAPDVNERGNPTPHRWRLEDLEVTVDFLLPALPDGKRGGQVQPLEGDFGALVAPGLELAFEERQEVELEGDTLTGEKARRRVPVCGPAAFVVLKALAFADRSEPKDAYDLIYVLRRWPGGAAEIASRLAEHHRRHSGIVEQALTGLANDFADPDHVGPRRAASFVAGSTEDLDAAAADAHGYVDDLLRAAGTLGIR
ncbi:MAG: nucleotidyl transferase AbiEii/AbiGii toxin family protein [Actinomycetota bacterium]|nr:nucleotidyl transferase AbiEii/AbiGii toxin family protein [Actinomycetota bacterium]